MLTLIFHIIVLGLFNFLQITLFIVFLGLRLKLEIDLRLSVNLWSIDQRYIVSFCEIDRILKFFPSFFVDVLDKLFVFLGEQPLDSTHLLVPEPSNSPNKCPKAQPPRIVLDQEGHDGDLLKNLILFAIYYMTN